MNNSVECVVCYANENWANGSEHQPQQRSSRSKSAGKVAPYWLFLHQAGYGLFFETYKETYMECVKRHVMMMDALWQRQDQERWQQIADEENGVDRRAERRERQEGARRANLVNNASAMAERKRAMNLKNQKNPRPIQKKFELTIFDMINELLPTDLEFEKQRFDKRGELKNLFRLNKATLSTLPISVLTMNVYGHFKLDKKIIYEPSELTLSEFTLEKGLCTSYPHLASPKPNADLQIPGGTTTGPPLKGGGCCDYQSTMKICRRGVPQFEDEKEVKYYESVTGISGSLSGFQATEAFEQIIERSKDRRIIAVATREYRMVTTALLQLAGGTACDGTHTEQLKSLLSRICTIDDLARAMVDFCDTKPLPDLEARRVVMESGICPLHLSSGDKRLACSQVQAVSIVHNLLALFAARRVLDWKEHWGGPSLIRDGRVVEIPRYFSASPARNPPLPQEPSQKALGEEKEEDEEEEEEEENDPTLQNVRESNRQKAHVSNGRSRHSSGYHSPQEVLAASPPKGSYHPAAQRPAQPAQVARAQSHHSHQSGPARAEYAQLRHAQSGPMARSGPVSQFAQSNFVAQAQFDRHYAQNVQAHNVAQNGPSPTREQSVRSNLPEEQVFRGNASRPGDGMRAVPSSCRVATRQSPPPIQPVRHPPAPQFGVFRQNQPVLTDTIRTECSYVDANLMSSLRHTAAAPKFDVTRRHILGIKNTYPQIYRYFGFFSKYGVAAAKKE